MPDQFEKPHRIDDLEKKLYSPNQTFSNKERTPLRPQEFDVQQDWSNQKPVSVEPVFESGEKKTNWFLGFFILAFIFFLGALLYAGFRFYFDDGIDASNVDILINAPLTIGAGEVLDFETVIQNKNQLDMKYVDIEVLFPDGTRSSADVGINYPTVRESIESISVGEIIKKNYDALLFGEEGDKKEIIVVLMYQVDGSTTLFKKEKKFDIVLKSTPIRMTISNIKEITSGQEVVFTVELVSNSTQTLKDVMVQAAYPFGFVYKSSSLTVEEDKKTWIIPTLAAKESITFTIKGVIEGQNKDDRFFNFVVGLQDPLKNTPQIVFSTKGTTVSIARPFLELDFAIDNKNSDMLILDSERNQSAIISFKNNTESALRNVSISLGISGSSINEDSIFVGSGFYQSINDTITWDNTTSEKLTLVPVGSSGTVGFTFNGFGVGSEKFTTNPEAVLTLRVQGNRNPESGVSDVIENSLIQKIRFNTQVSLSTYSEYYSPLFINTGPIPPKAEQKTTYTSLIRIKNSTNIISDGIVSMRIPNYVKYEGTFSPTTENVSYDPITRIVVWNVGDIGTNIGYMGNEPRTLALQLSIIPSVSQVGTDPVLVENIKFAGKDTFTQNNILTTAQPISTAILDSRDYYSSQVSR